MIKKVLGAITALAMSCAVALAAFVPVKFITLNTTNSTLVFAKQGFLGAGQLVNSTATAAWFKLYDKATAPTCGTDVPKWTLAIPANTTPQGVPLPTNAGIQFANGIGFCVTGAFADNDTTAAPAGIIVNLGISGR
jgi:hypothetical protein